MLIEILLLVFYKNEIKYGFGRWMTQKWGRKLNLPYLLNLRFFFFYLLLTSHLVKLPKWNLTHANWLLLSLFALRSLNLLFMSISSLFRSLSLFCYLALLLCFVLHHKLKQGREEEEIDQSSSSELIVARQRGRRKK